MVFCRVRPMQNSREMQYTRCIVNSKRRKKNHIQQSNRSKLSYEHQQKYSSDILRSGSGKGPTNTRPILSKKSASLIYWLHGSECGEICHLSLCLAFAIQLCAFFLSLSDMEGWTQAVEVKQGERRLGDRLLQVLCSPNILGLGKNNSCRGHCKGPLITFHCGVQVQSNRRSGSDGCVK